MNELWRDIDGYKGVYQVSNTGQVRSLDRQVPHKGGFRTAPGQRMQLGKIASGHIFVGLWKDSKRKTFHVRHLVATAFLDEPQPGQEVRHKNGDKADNRPDNLEWTFAKKT